MPNDLPNQMNQSENDALATIRGRLDILENETKGAINVRDYGALGDGFTDDSAAIQAALDAANGAGGGTVCLPFGTYKIVKHPLRVYSNTHLWGNNSIIDGTSYLHDGVIYATGSVASPILLTVDANFGDLSVTLASVTGLAVDDWIQLGSSTTYSSEPTACPIGQLNRIVKISGLTVYLDTKVFGTQDELTGYTVSAGAKVARVTFVNNVTIEGLTILGNDTGGVPLSLWRAHGCRVENINIIGGKVFALQIMDSRDCLVSRCNIQEGAAWASLDVNVYLNYGFAVGGYSRDITFRGCRTERYRHGLVGVTGSSFGISRFILVEDCGFHRTRAWGSIDDHTGLERMTVSNCIFDNTETYLTPLDAASVSHYGMNAVMNYLKIINCRFSGYRYAIKLRDSKGGIISGCNFSDCGTPITLSGTQLDKIDNNSFYACGTAILFSDASSSFINITNNFFVAFKNAGIETASGMAGSISHVNILGNTFKDAAVTPIYLHSPGQTYINISDNHFVNISVTTKIADIINYSSIRHLNNLYDNIASGHTVSTYIKTMVNYITWDPPSFGDGLSEESPDISVIDAVEGDMVLVAPATAAYDLHGLVLSAYVSSTGNVRVVLKNGTGASRDLTSRTFRVRIIKTSD